MSARANHRPRWQALVAVVAAGLLAGCEDAAVEVVDDTHQVVTMIVGDTERYRTYGYPGRAKATQQVNVGFEVEGKVIERPVDVGSVVQRGDLLAALDPAPYEARIRAVQGERATLEAALANAETELARRDQLLRTGFVSQAAYDDQVTLVRAAEARIEAVNGVLEEAEIALGHTRIYAPFDGTISRVFVENFQNVLAKQPVVRLLDTTRIEMEVQVPEAFIALAPHVEDVTVTFASLPDVEVAAKITEIGTEASATTRTYPVTVVMEQPPGSQIEAGMAGRAVGSVKLPADWERTGVEVPASTVVSPSSAAPGETFVWRLVEERGTVTKQPVEIVGLTPRGMLIKGLATGARIVTVGGEFLTEGAKVEVVDPASTDPAEQG